MAKISLNDEPETDLKKIDLFPNKIQNMEGREVVVRKLNDK